MKLRAMALVLSLFSPVLVAQGASKKPISLPKLPPTTPQGTEGAFWRTDNNFDPILRLKNVLLKQSLQVTPSIYFADGTQYNLPTVTLEPAGTAQVNLRYAIDSAPANIQSHISTYGMAGIDYQWSWPAVIATIQNTDEIASLTFVSSFRSDVRQAHANPEVASSQVVRGTWWLPTPDSDGFLVLENPSLNPKQVDIRISGSAGNQLAQQQVTLPSHATSFVKFSALFGDVRGAETMGGIDIRYTGPKYGVLIYGGIVDETHGYSASPILMEDHLDPDRPTHAVTLSVPGLLLGNADPAMEFPTETYFRPYALLHNLSAHAMQVSLSLTTQGTSGQPQDISLNPVTLAPGQVLKYDFASQFGKSNPLPDGYGSLTASFQGRDGELQIHAGSVDQSHSYVFEVAASQQVETASRTLCFWSIEGDNDSMITVWNYKPAPQDLNLTLHYSGGQYVLPIHLAPRQAYNLDMLSLVRSRVPDTDGNLIPSNIFSGSGTLASSGGETQPISVALASSVFNVRNATCGSTCYTCDGATQTYFQPSPLNVAVGGTQGAQFQITWNTGSVYTNPSGSTWNSGNTSVATVDSNGNVTGQSAGQSAINVTDVAPVYANICSADHAAPCPVEPIGGGGPESTNPKVTFASLQTVVAGQTANEGATVDYGNGVPSGPAVTLVLSPSGTGTATFANGQTSFQITQSAQVPISGGHVSQGGASDVQLDATYASPDGGGVQSVAVNPQQFNVVAIPVNFTTYNETNLSNGTLQFSYTWQSSDGNLSDIASCQVGEQVSYPGNGSTYTWPLPMVNNNPTPNPTVLNGPGNQTGPNGTTAGMGDYQRPPDSYQKPYQQASFQATQVFQWECPGYNGGNFYRFTPSITITRSVTQNSGGQWVYQVTKSGFGGSYSNSAPLP